MALIKCPECGKEISDTAKFCVNCGFTIQKWLSQQAAQEAAERAKAAREEKAAQKKAAALEKAMAENPDDPEAVLRRRKKKWFVICGAVVLAAVIAVVLILVLKPKNRVPEYKLKYSMSDEEIVQYMEERGYIQNKDMYEKYNAYIFSVPEDVLGIRPSAVQISRHFDHLEISFAYLGNDYDIWELPDEYPRFRDMEDTYRILKENATAFYGQPEEDSESSNYRKGLVWDESETVYKLYRYQETDIVSFDIYLYEQ